MREITNAIRFRIGTMAIVRADKNLNKWRIAHNKKYLKRVLYWCELGVAIAPRCDEKVTKAIIGVQSYIELLKRAVRG